VYPEQEGTESIARDNDVFHAESRKERGLRQSMLSAVYVAGLAAAEGLRFPARMRRAGKTTGRGRLGRSKREAAVMAGILAGVWILPLIRIFSSRLDAFDFHLPSWTAWTGIGLFAASLAVRLAGQTALGDSWSPTGDASGNRRLVTSGIYSRIRHPLYASMVLWGAAQPMLLPNGLAGFGGILAAVLIWCVRVPAEERALAAAFGDAYVAYAGRTGRIAPRMGRKARQVDGP
jgi:protein-S-isoprenylcysteine O-methyltransferase Ste14